MMNTLLLWMMATTNENISINVDVLANDTDVDNDQLQVTNYSSPASGTLTLNNSVFH